MDADEAPTDLSRIAWKVINNAQWPRDLVFAGSRMGLDATRKLPEESGGVLSEEIRKDERITSLIDRKWQEYGCT